MLLARHAASTQMLQYVNLTVWKSHLYFAFTCNTLWYQQQWFTRTYLPKFSPYFTQPKSMTPANAYTSMSKNIPIMMKKDLNIDMNTVNINIFRVAWKIQKRLRDACRHEKLKWKYSKNPHQTMNTNWCLLSLWLAESMQVTQWFGSLINVAIRTCYFWQANKDYHNFTTKELLKPLKYDFSFSYSQTNLNRLLMGLKNCGLLGQVVSEKCTFRESTRVVS